LLSFWGVVLTVNFNLVERTGPPATGLNEVYRALVWSGCSLLVAPVCYRALVV
jgi:hypothetical protein